MLFMKHVLGCLPLFKTVLGFSKIWTRQTDVCSARLWSQELILWEHVCLVASARSIYLASSVQKPLPRPHVCGVRLCSNIHIYGLNTTTVAHIYSDCRSQKTDCPPHGLSRRFYTQLIFHLFCSNVNKPRTCLCCPPLLKYLYLWKEYHGDTRLSLLSTSGLKCWLGFSHVCIVCFSPKTMTLLVDGRLLALSNSKDHRGMFFCSIFFLKTYRDEAMSVCLCSKSSLWASMSKIRMTTSMAVLSVSA